MIFSSQRRAEDAGYAQAAARMEELAAEQPGYLGFESARDASGFGISVSYWSSLEAVAAFRAHAEHRLVQQAGRERFYAWYRLRVARVQRELCFPLDRVP